MDIDKILKKYYKEIVSVSMDLDNKKYYEKYSDNIYKLNGEFNYYTESFPYKRIFEGSEYIDFIDSDKFKYKHFSYLYNPKEDSYITFKDSTIQIKPPEWNQKIYFTELYLPYINSSIINIYLNKTEKVGKYYIDYDNRNITIFDYVEHKIYRYTKNTSFESTFKEINDPCFHNNIVDSKLKIIDDYNIIRGNIHYNYTKATFNIIESVYDYNIPANIYENKFENMRAKIILDLDYKTDRMKNIIKIIYAEKEGE